MSQDHETVRSLICDYFASRLLEQPAYPHLKPALPVAKVLVTGGFSIGTARCGSDLDIEMIVPDELYPAMLQGAGGPRGLRVHDEAHTPLVDEKVRPMTWLRRRLAGDDPESLWIYQHAVVVQDPDAQLPARVALAAERFREHVPQLVASRYRTFRSLVTIEDSREELCRQVMLGKAIESALTLPLLAREEPHPYPKWQAWWLVERHARGAEVVNLCRRMLAKPVTREAFEPLRRIIDDILIEAGYREGLVRNFWRKL
ncbi:hypothetical protein J2Z79_001197 [Symbiobacterium terraclitae]|uniref:Polymerase nucleotidyl transferase domain-containing protein n=1 Tax=Symbiobacterium terraclitae TaxID=557451 RepID=A0ABS4JQL3_9FIRM|nr:hypothetical protein [Symbiobacterium terraclitae]MBP2017812.1 hypothetical protein [Symbiobacterium terraclitae]